MQVSEPSAKYTVKTAEYKQTEAGHIPADWRLGRLADVAQIRSGITKNSKAAIDNPVSVHYLRVANVQDGYLDLSDMSQLLVSQSDIKRHEVLPGDMLMNEGGDLDKLGRGALWRGKFSPCIHQNHVFVVRSGSQLIPEFLQAWTGSAGAKNYFMLAGRQTTNLASINKTALGQLPIPLPALEEQQAIAAALSDTDALIDALEQLLVKKRQVKQGAMHELVTGSRRLDGFNAPWKQSKLGQLLKIAHGKNQRAVENSEGVYPILATGGQIGKTNSFLYNQPSVLIGRKGTIDNPKYMDTPFWTVDTLFYSIIQKPNSAKYIYYVFCLIDWLQHNEASGVPSLSAKKIEQIEISLPDPSEQTAIAAILSDMDTDITELETRLGKVRQVKQGMMRELLTGRTRLV